MQLLQGNAAVYRALLSVSMFCPLAAVLAAKKVYLHQPTGIGWKVQGKRRYWLAARGQNMLTDSSARYTAALP